MYYYFSADYTAGLKLNGKYLGLIDSSITGVSVLDERTFIEICPINSTERTINFVLNDDFISNPPPCVKVTDLKGGYLIKLVKTYLGGEFKVLSQQKYNDLIVTVYNENGVKISIETQKDFLIENIPTDSSIVNFYRPEFDSNLIAVAFRGKKTLLTIFSTADKISKVFFGLVDEFCFEKEFITTENFLDIAKHTLKISWQFNGDSFYEKERVLECSSTFNKENLNEKVLPFAFLEELMLCGDIKQYLADNLIENASKLKSFFGDYIGVMPPPSFRVINEVGLIYKQTENSYFVNYFSFEVENGKINRIIKCD
jgi:hypothetical protein